MDQSLAESVLRKNLASVEERMVAACRRAGRDVDEITLVAVTKNVEPEVAALLPHLGIRDLGENRPQELWHKAAAIWGVRWHLIGHLQRNKIEGTLPLVHLIHSVDSLRLLEALERAADKQRRRVEVFLEVNASGEASKHGFLPEELVPLAACLNPMTAVRIRGLMTMAALQEAEKCRATFATLRQQRDRLARELGPPHQVEHLSMGMSNDFEVAIEEGATFVRLGTVLFQGLTGAAP